MAKKVTINAEQFAERWQEGLQGASAKIEAGINAVNTAPGQSAAQQADVWMQRLQDSKEKWKKNVAAVSLEDWKQAAIEKGIPNLQASLNLGRNKVMKAAGKLIPAINNALASPNMPKRGATIEQNVARVTFMAKELRKAFSS